MAKKTESHFDAKLFRFLGELALNNHREWFEANKERYQREVRDPFLRFIADFAPRLEKINEHWVADPRPSGGSFFRIYRDVRFAKDKTPYTTHAAAQFRHARGKDVHAPGFYLHLEPNNSFVGVGMWHPEADALKKIRAAIMEKPKKWKSLVDSKTFTAEWSLSGEKLTRAPKGIDPEHPMLEHLKRTDFIAVAELKQKIICSPGFIDHFAKLCRSAAPFNGFLAQAIGLPS
jgi:uncharacterized protein (TIGR02453 family)